MRLVVEIVPGYVAQRPGLPVAGQRAVHDRWIDGADRRIADAEAVRDARSVALHHDVGRTRERQHPLALCLVLEVDGDGALSRIEDGEQVRENAHRVTARWLHLDDVSAHLDEQLRRVGHRPPDPEVEHPNAIEQPGPSTGVVRSHPRSMAVRRGLTFPACGGGRSWRRWEWQVSS